MPPPIDDHSPESNAGTVVIVCFGIMGAAFAFISTYALFGPTLFILATLFAFFGGLHYWLWGRSMTEAGGSDAGSATES